MTRVVVLGDLNLDIAASLRGKLPRGGEVRTLIRTAPGGSAANFARTAAQEGVKVVFIGCVGDDPAGRVLVDALVGQGIETHVKRALVPTGTIISLTDGPEHTMLCSRGANDALDESFIDPSWFRDAIHLHLSGYTFLSSGQMQAVNKAIKLAKTSGLTVSLTAPSANLIRNFGVNDFLAALAPIDWLFLNLDEGKVITGMKRAEDIANILSQKFTVGALTRGKDGSLAWAGEDRDRGVTMPISNVDTTGAGDVFAAGFVISYLNARDLKQANRRAVDTASSFLRSRVRLV